MLFPLHHTQRRVASYAKPPMAEGATTYNQEVQLCGTLCCMWAWGFLVPSKFASKGVVPHVVWNAQLVSSTMPERSSFFIGLHGKAFALVGVSLVRLGGCITNHREFLFSESQQAAVFARRL